NLVIENPPVSRTEKWRALTTGRPGPWMKKPSFKCRYCCQAGGILRAAPRPDREDPSVQRIRLAQRSVIPAIAAAAAWHTRRGLVPGPPPGRSVFFGFGCQSRPRSGVNLLGGYHGRSTA